MGIPAITEHKKETAYAGAGAGVGALIGHVIYKNTPTPMVKLVRENGALKESVTDTFINYAVRSYKKSLMSEINPHTDRAWLYKQMSIIRQTASKAKANPAQSKWHFQQLYDLGLDYLTGRKAIRKEDLGLAKRGAAVIEYGRKFEKRAAIGGCAAICALSALAIKFGIDKYKELKNKQKDS